jgi:hypothetical protein
MAGYEIVDFKPILDGGDALFERVVFSNREDSLNCDSQRIGTCTIITTAHFGATAKSGIVTAARR